MKQYSLSEEEVFTLAYIAQKETLYGISDPFIGLDPGARISRIYTVIDELMCRGLVTMTFDGRYGLDQEVSEWIDMISGCDQYLCIQTNDAGYQTRQKYWKLGDRILLAESVDQRDLFRYIHGEEFLRTMPCIPEMRAAADAEILQSAMLRAKRLCGGGKEAEAIRVLRQGGADERTAEILVAAMTDQAWCMMLVCLDNRCADGSGPAEKLYLCGKGYGFELREAMTNYRSCVKTAAIQKDALKEIAEAFLEEAKESGRK